MKPFRLLAAFAVTLGVTICLGDLTTAQDAPTKADKKAKNKNKNKLDPAAQAPLRPAVPVKPIVLPSGPKDAAALARIIDAEVDKALAAAKVATSPAATDEEFVRRVYLDVTGVIPTGEQARAFLDSKAEDRREKLIDDLLASPNFGKRLADVWFPKLFPRDSNNRFVLRDPLVKWLTDKFNANTPWNVFVFELVTATGTVEENPAVTYYLANRSVDKLTDGITQHFLGIQLQCAQCHNHPFTDWKQTEYWGMAEFFARVRPDNPKNANKGGDNTKVGVQETAARTKVKDFFPESAKQVAPKFLGGAEVKIAATEPARPILARWMTAPDNPFFAKAMVNRTWAALFGSGFVNPIDDMHDDNPASHPALLDAMARDFGRNGFDVKFLYKSILLSKAYGRTSKPAAGNDKDEALFSHQAVKVMSPEQLFDSLAQATGLSQQVAARQAKNPMAKGQPSGPRDQFVNFFLAGADAFTPTEYEAGIPQALRLMNSRQLAGNPQAVRLYQTNAKDEPRAVLEKMFLATLARRPTPAEVTRLTNYVQGAGTQAEGYGDVLWAILNSSEFTMIR
ncbi:DUF1549 and DUF1553 domain-containing protein [Urbifossiella limnaea]|uniref:DUF1553 domain-containing protein n=1 Tax=Urbifossiella limnaea TaxID=2528023 RepID=A0A517Y3Q7_9BACT|nr:DUF1549 and DUF1553 domain-containing protein [Urbifossiella limnaea]QDU24324.1 hypothetical protein ETAA1_63380 [Urbifossiella limnaea]